MHTIGNIMRANREAGFHFFAKDTLTFFDSKISDDVYEGPGGVYFVTSELDRHRVGNTSRMYTVRRFTPETGNVSTAGKFYHHTQPVAHRLAQQFAAGDKEPMETK